MNDWRGAIEYVCWAVERLDTELPQELDLTTLEDCMRNRMRSKPNPHRVPPAPRHLTVKRRVVQNDEDETPTPENLGGNFKHHYPPVTRSTQGAALSGVPNIPVAPNTRDHFTPDFLLDTSPSSTLQSHETQPSPHGTFSQEIAAMFSLKKITASGDAGIYEVKGLVGTIRVPQSLLAEGASFPTSLEIDLPLATPKAGKVKETKEERKARLANMSPAEKNAAKIEAARKRLAALEAAM